MPRKRNKHHKKLSAIRLFISVLCIISIVLIAENQISRYHLDKYIPHSLKEIVGHKDNQSAKPIDDRIDNIEIPARLYDREEQIIRHTGYTVSYNEELRLPNWVAYELTREKTNGTFNRTNRFIPDPQVNGICPSTQDYSNSGYDRGHMAPAADMKWNVKAMKESFYLSNICPQLHNLNAGDWKELEEKVRKWAQKDSLIFIVCGPIVKKSPKRIGINKVAVPNAFFKVILSPSGKFPKAIGFMMEHKKGNQPLRSYAISVDSIESVTGIDFFPALPDDIEQKIEKEFSTKQWGI